MKLYHITDNMTKPDTKRFVPRVPKSTMHAENKTLPRICFCPTIELCLQAAGLAITKPNGAPNEIKIYCLDTETISPDSILHPDEIKDWVPDAITNQEYWVMEPVTLTSIGTYLIKDVDYENGIIYESLAKEDVYHVLKEICPGFMDIYERPKGYDIKKLILDVINTFRMLDEPELAKKLINELRRYPYAAINIVKHVKLEPVTAK